MKKKSFGSLETRRKVYLILGIIFVLIGTAYLISNVLRITGLIVSEGEVTPSENLLGLFFVVLGLGFLSKARKRKAKGQVALEFLLTYGWAILAAVIALGTIASIGFLRADTPDAVIVSAPLNAQGTTAYPYNDPEQLGSTFSRVDIELTNGYIRSISVTGTEISASGNDGSCTYAQVGSAVAIPSGQSEIITAQCPNAGILTQPGNKINGDVKISYVKADSSLTQDSTGTISVAVRG